MSKKQILKKHLDGPFKATRLAFNIAQMMSCMFSFISTLAKAFGATQATANTVKDFRDGVGAPTSLSGSLKKSEGNYF